MHETPPAEEKAEGSSRRRAYQSVGVSVFSLCPAPSIDASGGISARTCLSEASFRARRPNKPVNEASIMLSGKAPKTARRAVIVTL